VQEADPYGVESEYNSFLVQHQSKSKGLPGVLAQYKGTDSVEVTLSVQLQQIAKNALGPYLGAIVAIDLQNGAVLAMYSNPTYDPNGLTSLDPTADEKYYNSKANDRPNPSWGGALRTKPPITRSPLARPSR
jgi:penicillin-binding protein A